MSTGAAPKQLQANRKMPPTPPNPMSTVAAPKQVQANGNMPPTPPNPMSLAAPKQLQANGNMPHPTQPYVHRSSSEATSSQR